MGQSQAQAGTCTSIPAPLAAAANRRHRPGACWKPSLLPFFLGKQHFGFELATKQGYQLVTGCRSEVHSGSTQ